MLTDVASKEWGNEDDEYALECLRKHTTYTIIDEKGYKNIICFVPKDDTEYMFFIKDKRSSSMVMKYFAKILDERAKKTTVWSLAQPNQDKMHKFLGATKIGFEGDKEIWVK